MFKKLLFTLILYLTTIQLVYSNDIHNSVENDNEALVGESVDNVKIKNFIKFAKNIVSKHKENSEEIENKLEAAKSESCVYIISSCNGAQFFELTRFKLKNKKLFLKLGYILLNLIAKIKAEDLQILQLSKHETADLLDVLTYISSFIPDETKSTIQLCEKPSLSKNEKFQDIMQKVNPALKQLFEYSLGLESTTLSSLSENFEKYLSCVLDKSDIKELHSFVTKKNGAFDKMVEKIDPIWEIIIKCLS
ncbi:MAG: hypothetical protein US49_C0001G0154 [candidate division TM6 bacterium GW2011_GWF2_37_49]|nr:MAG: hypothetical protein US49_C0001G0154 [candidate division TM6 bacterium GW2011_GWF2_37_49]